MKPNSIRSKAFTCVELIIVIAFVLVLVSMIMPFRSTQNRRTPRITCVNNLKQIGTAYRIWSNDRNDHFPMMESATSGGCSEILISARPSTLCWSNYAVMSNELDQATKTLVCPADDRSSAQDFTTFNSNITLSYLVGASTDNSQPQSLLGGDRNLGPGLEPSREYGYSPNDGTGNDVAIRTNSNTGPVCWSLRMHSGGNSAGAGNILLGDGSAQQVSSGSLRLNWQPHFQPTTNWPTGRIPPSPSIRVLFP